ncbi:MAG: transcriptional repressor LexA [Clostridiales bacterium]|nr:transcriptional repressor LexA [Clostridiales bacterium]
MDKTQETYEFIEKYLSENRYPPTIREICEKLNFDSTSSAVYHLKKLEKAGKILRNDKKNRAIELTEKVVNGIELPVLGEIAAGTPILAEENLIDKITVSENFFIGTNLFILKVKGDSMINVGIYDGDYVVINKQSVANNGEIVACLLENEATVKRFYKENGYFRLQPENNAMLPIYSDNVEVLGKVVGLIRNKI